MIVGQFNLLVLVFFYHLVHSFIYITLSVWFYFVTLCLYDYSNFSNFLSSMLAKNFENKFDCNVTNAIK